MHNVSVNGILEHLIPDQLNSYFQLWNIRRRGWYFW